jgi:hypothetical protein
MLWEVIATDVFDGWFGQLTQKERKRVAASIGLLEQFGPALRHPHSSDIRGSRHGGMRELRIQVGGLPYRVLYAFDPNRDAILLLGGDKTGDEAWYTKNVPIADDLFDQHLEALKKEKEGQDG